MLQLRLLGTFEASDPGRSRIVTIGSKKNRALLGFLALQPQLSASRSRLAGLLWSDRDERHARSSLRQSLLSLRKDLEEVRPSAVLAEEDRIGLRADEVRVDVAEFKRLASSNSLSDLQAAASSYSGPLLDQLTISDPSYQEWIADARSQLFELLTAALERLWQREQGEGRIAALRRLLAIDPTRETAHCALMIELARLGDLASALQQYERCKEQLRQELNVRPGPRTEELRRRILEGRIPEMQPQARAEDPKPPLLPSLVVMPFVNVGADPAQQYFSDGITSDLITDLSRFPSLRVIASHSAFAYKGRAADIPSIARELGVSYIVEGSVQRAGRQLRINVQLVEASTGRHLWTERYSRSLRGLFALQDEIVRSIVATVPSRVEHSERERAMRKPAGSLEAYDHYLRGIEVWFGWTEATNRQAQEHFRKAISLDPGYARAYGALSSTLIQSALAGWADRPEAVFQEARGLAQTGAALGPSDFENHQSLGFACLYCRDFDRSLACYQKAVELNPNSADLLADMAEALAYIGETAEAVAKISQAKQLNPISPDWYDWVLGIAAYHDGRYREALAALTRVVNPPNLLRRHLTATYVRLGRLEEARAIASEILKQQPGYRLATEALVPFRNLDVLHAFIADLRLAGLPD